MCDMTHPYVRTWLIHVCDMTATYMCIGTASSYVLQQQSIHVTRV